MDSVNFGLHICRDTVWTEAYLQEYSVNWGLHAGTECESTLTCRHTVWTEAYIYAETQCELRLTCKNIVWTEAYLQTHSVNWGLHAGTECESRLTCRNIVWTKAYMQAHSVNQPLLADTQCELRLTCRHRVWINPYLQAEFPVFSVDADEAGALCIVAELSTCAQDQIASFPPDTAAPHPACEISTSLYKHVHLLGSIIYWRDSEGRGTTVADWIQQLTVWKIYTAAVNSVIGNPIMQHLRPSILIRSDLSVPRR